MKYHVERIPQDDDELWEYVATSWGIYIPRHRVCPNHSAPFDAFAEAYFGRVPVSVWKGSRGLAGKSMTLAALCATEAATLGAHVTILGGSSAQSQRVHEVSQEAWEHPLAPKSLLASQTMYVTRLTNRAWVRSLTASQRSARGPHPQRLRLDEIDEMDLAILEAAQGQPMDKIIRGRNVVTQTVMSSTHQYADKTMTEILKRAKLQGWSIHEWCVAGNTRVVSGDGIMPITQLQPGMEALTRHGYRKIQHVTRMGVKPTVVVTTNDGRRIVCTSDHKIATGDRDWCEAGSLVVGQRVVVADVITSRRSEQGKRYCQFCQVCALRMPTEESSEQVVWPVLENEGTTVSQHSVEALTSKGESCCRCNEVERIKTGTLCCGTHDVNGIDVSGASANRHVHRGLPYGRWNDGRGSVRMVTREVECGTRQSACALVEEEGLQSHRPLASFSTSVVSSVVPGDVIEVFDIGVEEAHEFVGEGIVVHNCYKESQGTPEHPGWLTQSLVDRKRQEIPKHMWDTEYDLQEPSITGRAIQTEFVESMFDKELGHYEGFEGEKIVIHRYKHGGTYVTGVDWAKESDWTIISTWRTDVRPWVRVAWHRTGRLPWPVMVRQVEQRLETYGGLLVHDATGIGNVVDDFLTYPREQVVPVIMAGRTREAMFNDYIAAIEHNEFRSAMIDYCYGEHKYVTLDDLYGSGHAPDSFVADSLAWYMRNDSGGASVGPANITRAGSSPWRSA